MKPDPFKGAATAAKVLFLPAPGRLGALIERVGRRRKQTPMRFPDAHAALDWCQANGAALIYVPAAPDPAAN